MSAGDDGLVAEGREDQAKARAHEAKGHLKDAAEDVKDVFRR